MAGKGGTVTAPVSSTVPLGDVALDPPIRVSRTASLREVAGLMADTASSCLLVGPEHPEVVTEHDLASGLAAGMGPDAAVGPLVSRSPVWATPTTSLADAVAMMTEHRIRHLVVVAADGRVQGVLSLTGAIRALLAVPA